MPSDQSDIQSKNFNTGRTIKINDKNGRTKHTFGPYSSQTSTPSTSNDVATTNFALSSKGLHIANLNVRHLLSKFDEIGIVLASVNGSDILGMCKIYLDSSTPDNAIEENHCLIRLSPLDVRNFFSILATLLD